MFIQFISWYVIVQLLALLILPLCVRLFHNLPDRGYAFARSLSILLVGVVFWFGYSYGFWRNESGGAWLTVLIVTCGSLWWGRTYLRLLIERLRSKRAAQEPTSRRSANGLAASLRSLVIFNGRYVLLVEALFLLAFAGWAIVRSYDPAVNHTEEPMDLMFMHSIWSSPTYPPQDAWLSGYAISYYYLGHWLLTTLGRLAGQPPSIAYNLGQACWFALLLTGCFGIVYNLLQVRRSAHESSAPALHAPKLSSVVGGVLAAIMVGVTGNVQAIVEWFYANGYFTETIQRWMSNQHFTNGARVTNQWFIAMPDWWWWRVARVLADTDLAGNHIEVIDEVPMFSYLLGDNHPHVLAMPFVLLVIALALNLFLGSWREKDPAQRSDLLALPQTTPHLLILIIATGALIFLNTWDFPVYWGLAILCWLAALLRRNDERPAEWRLPWQRVMLQALIFGAVLLVGSILLYLPYLFSAQSQASGVLPNLLNPTRFSQFLLMFAPHLLTALALILLCWPARPPTTSRLIGSLLFVIGAPLLLLLLATAMLARGGSALILAGGLALPGGAESYAPFVLERWLNAPWSFLVSGTLLALTIAMLWQRLFWQEPTPEDDDSASNEPEQSTRTQFNADTFALLLAACGLLLIFAPEFIYLDDYFPGRMNTVFKFYYQGWLLLGLSGAYTIVRSLAGPRHNGAESALPTPNLNFRLPYFAFSLLALVLVLAALILPLAGIYGRTNAFSSANRQLDALAYVGDYNPNEMAAIEWVRANTAPDAVVLQAIGRGYVADTSRISMATGRPTLLGWKGHEEQWRGAAFGEMAGGREQALTAIYRDARSEELPALLVQWQVDYVYIGGEERNAYQLTSAHEERLARVMSLVFEAGDVRIYARRNL